MSATSLDQDCVIAEVFKVEECCDTEAEDITMSQNYNPIKYEREALVHELHDNKQLMWVLQEENRILKVKLRRLEEILKKKNKIVDTHYLGSHNKIIYKEVHHQFTSKIESLRNENQDLTEELVHKDCIIRKLRKQLNTYSVYKPSKHSQSSKKKLPQSRMSSASASPSQGSDENICSNFLRVKLTDSCNNDSDEITDNKPYTDNQPDTASENVTDILRSEIASIQLETERVHHSADETERAISCTLLETPHKEIEKLHSGFNEILSEVGRLKQAIGEMNEKHSKAVSEMRIREKDLMARVYDKQYEIAYNNMQIPPGLRHAAKMGQQKGEKVQAEYGRKAKPIGDHDKATISSARVSSALARIPTKPRPNYSKPTKGKRSFMIKTASKNRLHTEADVQLYIDEVLHDMNRHS